MKNHAWLEEATRRELSCLWGDLYEARNSAINGDWSIKCDHLAGRIKDLTLLVGPTPWNEIQAPLLEAGIYQRIHAEISVSVNPDMEQVAQERRRSEERLAAIRAGSLTLIAGKSS